MTRDSQELNSVFSLGTVFAANGEVMTACTWEYTVKMLLN